MPVAANILNKMLNSYMAHQIVTPNDVDMGNIAPLLSNYVLLLGFNLSETHNSLIPCEQNQVSQYFQQAGLFAYSTSSYYAVLGISNGGILKIFDKEKKQIIFNDCGYIGQTKYGAYVTTQITNKNQVSQLKNHEFNIEVPFFKMLQSNPTPFKFIILRLLNLTIMHNIMLGNLLKKWLVKLLISGKKKVPLMLNRTIKFEPNQVIITDSLKGTLKLNWLKIGQEFVAIHMASSRYLERFSGSTYLKPTEIDLRQFNDHCEVKNEIRIEIDEI